MVTSTNYVIAGPIYNRTRPLTLWSFFQHLSAKYKDQKKSYDFRLGPLDGTASYYGKYGPD